MLKNKSGGFTLIEVTLVLAITAAMVAIIFSGQRAVRSQAEFNDTVNLVVSDLDAARNAAQTSNYSNNTTNGAASDNANGTGNVIWGVLVSTTRNSTAITITDIIGSAPSGTDQLASCATLASSEKLTAGYSYNINLGYGIKAQNGWQDTTYIVFHRSLCGGQLEAYNFSQDSLGGFGTNTVGPFCPYDTPAPGSSCTDTVLNSAASNYISNQFMTLYPINKGVDSNCTPIALRPPNYCVHNPYITNFSLIDSSGHYATITVDGTQGNSITASAN